MDFLRNLFSKKQPAPPAKGVAKLPPKVERLAAKLSDENDLTRLDAVKEIGNLRDPRAFEVLLKVYENDGEMDGIREAARDAIWQINPKWLPSIPGVEIVEECVSQLINLYDKTPSGEGFVAHTVSAQSIQQIGEKLNEAGGFQLMVLAHGRFKRQRPKVARNLEFAWSGIGDWEG